MTGTSRSAPGSVRSCDAVNPTTACRPANQVSAGGISSATSSASSCASTLASAFSMAAANRSNSARRSGSAGSASSSSAGSARASWARARRSPLFTAVVVVPSRSATCPARQSSTSRKISTARCRADRCCNAATKASRIPAREAATAAGSARSAASSASANGCSHGTSGPASASGSPLGAPSPDGSGRRPRRSSAVRHTLVAIRYSQVRTDDRPSNPSNDRHARR